MPARKTQLGEQVKSDVAAVRAEAMTDSLLGHYLKKMSDDIRHCSVHDRRAILRESAKRLDKESA